MEGLTELLQYVIEKGLYGVCAHVVLIYYKTLHSAWSFPEGRLISGLLGTLPQDLVLGGSLAGSEGFFLLFFTPFPF